MITKFNEYITEKYQNTKSYVVGDKVFIRYDIEGHADVTPVKIIKKLTKNNFIVSHNIEGSHLMNAPDHAVTLQDIVGGYTGVSDDTGLDPTVNPRIRPYVGDSIPTASSWSGDISFY